MKIRTKPLVWAGLILMTALLALAFPAVREPLLLSKAETEQSLGFDEAALGDAEEAHRIAPGDLKALSKAACLEEKLGHYKDALSDFAELYRIPSTKNVAVPHLASVQLALHDYDQALRFADEWIQVAPKDGEAYHTKGTALAHLNCTRDAVAALDEAIRLNPTSDAIAQRDSLMEKTKLMGQTFERIFDPALENNAQDRNALMRDTQRLVLGSNFEPAEKCAAAALKISPTPFAYYLHAHCCLRGRKYAQSLKDLAAVEHMVGHATFKWDCVVPEFKRVICPTGKEPCVTPDEVERVYAESYLGQRSLGPALLHINNAIAIDSKVPDYYLVRGMIYRAAGEREASVADLQKARQLKQSLPPSPNDQVIQFFQSEGASK